MVASEWNRLSVRSPNGTPNHDERTHAHRYCKCNLAGLRVARPSSTPNTSHNGCRVTPGRVRARRGRLAGRGCRAGRRALSAHHRHVPLPRVVACVPAVHPPDHRAAPAQFPARRIRGERQPSDRPRSAPGTNPPPRCGQLQLGSVPGLQHPHPSLRGRSTLRGHGFSHTIKNVFARDPNVLGPSHVYGDGSYEWGARLVIPEAPGTTHPSG